MPYKKILLLSALVAMTTTPALVHAEDAASPSYSMKKQGRVPFASEQTATTEQAPADAAQEPSSIEPAAGAEEPSEPTQERSALENQLRLPRKN